MVADAATGAAFLEVGTGHGVVSGSLVLLESGPLVIATTWMPVLSLGEPKNSSAIAPIKA